jgi:thiamine transport system permease protein
MGLARRSFRLLPLLFWAVFFAYPLWAIFRLSLFPDGRFDGSGFLNLATSSYYLETLGFTVGQAALSTLITLGLALPSAYVFVRFRFMGKKLLLALSTLPFVLPTVVVATAWSALIGDQGVINTALITIFGLASPPFQIERSLTLILIAHVFYNYAIALRLISGFWANQSPHLEDAAQVLGAHGWRLWWEIRLPLLWPAIASAAALVFIFTFTSFGVIVILGGLRYATLEVEIFNQARNLFNLPMAAALSLVQIGSMFALMLVYTRLQKRTPIDLFRSAQLTRSPKTWTERTMIALTIGLIGILVFSPLIALVIRSLQGGFSAYLRLNQNPRGSVLFVTPLEAIGNSLMFAVITTILAVILGLLTAYLIQRRGILDALFMLPLATSAVTLGFGYLLTMPGEIWVIPVVHTLVALPLVIRSILPALRNLPPHLSEAAQVLGATPWQVWRAVDLPLLRRGLIVGATFAFTVSMGEFGASLFLARPDTPTIPIVIFRLLGQPGATNYGQALAMSVILMIICAISFWIIEHTSGDF